MFWPAATTRISCISTRGQCFYFFSPFSKDPPINNKLQFCFSIMSQPLENYLPGFASLLEQIDKRVLVVLRDGRSLFGILRSIDQFANLVLHLTVERIYVGKEFGEIDRGVFLIRGENVVLCGEVEGDERFPGYTKVPIEVILANQASEIKEKNARQKLKASHSDALADDL